MNSGRLPKEFRNRTKSFAAQTIRLFVKLQSGKQKVESKKQK